MKKNSCVRMSAAAAAEAAAEIVAVVRAEDDVEQLFAHFKANLSSDSYCFEVRKSCCTSYRFLEIVKKKAPLLELYRNVAWRVGGSGGGDDDAGLSLFVVNEEDVASSMIEVPRAENRSVESFVRSLPRSSLLPVYPVPQTLVFRLVLFQHEHENG